MEGLLQRSNGSSVCKDDDESSNAGRVVGVKRDGDVTIEIIEALVVLVSECSCVGVGVQPTRKWSEATTARRSHYNSRDPARLAATKTRPGAPCVPLCKPHLNLAEAHQALLLPVGKMKNVIVRPARSC